MAIPETPRQNSRRTTIAKTVLTVAFVAVGIWYIGNRVDEFKTLSWPSSSSTAIVALGLVASVYFRALFNFVTSRHLGANISLQESFMLSAMVTAGNVILPANPGATFRAVYMKKVHAFPYAYFASSTALFVVITALMMSLLCALLLVLIQANLGYFRLDVFVAFPVIAIVALLALALRRGKIDRDDKSVWSSLKNSYIDLVRDRNLVVTSVLIVAANFAVASIVWTVVLRDYAEALSMLEGSLFAVSQIASGLINLTPGAAGFQEIVGMYIGRSFAMTAVELLGILIWVRLVRVLTAMALGLPCAILLRLRSA